MNENEDVVSYIISAAQDRNGKLFLTCAAAFELAEKHNIKLTEIGRICNKHTIKICNCQLGCFK